MFALHHAERLTAPVLAVQTLPIINAAADQDRYG